MRLLAEAEDTCSTKQGADRLWQDKARLAAVLEMLKRPASGSAYTQWAASNELRKAAKVCGVQKWQTHHLQQVARSQMKLLGW